MLAQETDPHEDMPNPRFNQILFGLAGGLVGAIVMGLIAYLTPPPNTGGNPFFIATANLIGFGDLAWGVGWLLNVLTGMSLGAIFGVLATRGSRGTRKVGNKMLLGVLLGLAAWTALFVPLMLILSPASVSAEALGGGLIFNLTFGVIVATVFAIGQSFMLVERVVVAHVCDNCGLPLSSNDELTTHRLEKHMRPGQRLQPQRAIA
ncbi:MAG: hypothetical protein OK455_08275 [Thaumarchaeota archaeon]|nr:hypothetical protein [Nitrososphaerota archaeon]